MGISSQGFLATALGVLLSERKERLLKQVAQEAAKLLEEKERRRNLLWEKPNIGGEGR